MKKRLPVIAERALADVKALQINHGHAFERKFLQKSIAPTCKKGCASCCSHPFLVSIAEGVLMYRWLRDNNKWTNSLRKQIKEAREKVLGLAFEIWLLSNISCPLLDEGNLCSAYEARPLRCRVTYSAGDPSMCRTNRLGPDTPLIPSASTVIGFTRASLALLGKAGADGRLMPLAEALLLGEAVATGEIELKEADLRHMMDLV